ncbi:MAG: hypothetical protein L6R42_009185, partial [Xanthoria sp. 1 TBL-2021]
NGIWLRRRTTDASMMLEAKVRISGDFSRSTFDEITDWKDITAVIRPHLPEFSTKKKGLGLDLLAEFTTTRQEFRADDKFAVVLDYTDFGHSVGEVELMAEDEKEAHREIDHFMARYPWFFMKGKAEGKLEAYFRVKISQIPDGQVQAPAPGNPNAQGPPVSMMQPSPSTVMAPISAPAITAPASSASPVQAPSAPIAAPPASSAAPIEAPSAPIAAPPATSAAPAPLPIASSAPAPAPIVAPSPAPASPSPVYPVSNGTAPAASGVAPSGFATGTASAPAETTSSTAEAPITPAVPGAAALVKVQMGIWAVVGVALGAFVLV